MKKISKLLRNLFVFIISIAIFAFFSVGCSNNNSPPEDPTPPIEAPKDDDKNDNDNTSQTIKTSYEDWQNKYLYDFYNGSYIDYIKTLETDDEVSSATKKALSSVLEIKTSSSTGGSGIIFDIDDENNVFVVTNYHVAYNHNSFTAKFYGSTETFSLDFIGGSSTYDIAVLYGKNISQLETQNAKAVTFNLNNIKTGDVCLALGNTGLKGIKATKGEITNQSKRYTANVAGYETEHRFICHSAQITNGNSGGGLFNKNGDFIGITNGGLSSDKSVKLAIPASIVYSTTKNIIANCFEKENTQVIECSLGFELIENLSENGKSLFKVDKPNSAIWPNLQMGDELLSFKIITPAETIEKNVTAIYDLDDFKMLLVSGSSIELTLSREGNSENIIVSATYEQLSPQPIK